MSANDEKRYKENYNKLLSQGVDKAWLDSNYGQAIENKSMSSISSAWSAYQSNATKTTTTTKTSELDARAPEFLRNDPSWANLPDDMKEIAIYNYEIQKANDLEKAKALASALEQATAQADPYWKSIIRVAQDEVLRGVEEATGDFTSGYARLQRNIEELNAGLASNKEYLTLEQQAQLASLTADLQDQRDTFTRNMEYMGAQKASQLRGMELDYNKAISDIESNMEFTTEEKNAALATLAQNFKQNTSAITKGSADAGLTFSTKRKLAQQQLDVQNQGMVESTNRQYNKAMSDMASNQAYTAAQYQQQTGNVNTQYQYQADTAQAQMGTAERQVQEARDKTQRDYAKQIADLESSAASGNTEALAQIEDLKRKQAASITAAGRSAEATLGTNNLPELQGYTPLGGVTGTLYDQQVKDIEERKKAIYGELTGTTNLNLA